MSVSDASALTRALAPTPTGRLLGSPRHALLLTASGTGYATAGDRALTRWRGDRLRDADGFFVYLRDAETGDFWSAAFAPTRRQPQRYEVDWAPGRATFVREDDGIESRMEVCVAPGEPPVEVRRVTLTNRSDRPRRIELTTVAEPVLQSRAGDLSHPAFSKLFVQTEKVGGRDVLLARRRPRGADEQPYYAVHAVVGEGGDTTFETDRMRFIGRGRSVHAPAALATDAPLSETTGDVLDPVVSLRRTVRLAPGESATVTVLLAGAETRDQALSVADRFEAEGAVDDAFRQAAAAEAPPADWTPEAEQADALIAGILYGAPELRAPTDAADPDAPEPDLPPGLLLAVRVASESGVRAARALAAAAERWRQRGTDTVLLLLDAGGRADTLETIPGAHVRASVPPGVLGWARLWADDALPELATAEAPSLPPLTPPPGPQAVEADESLAFDNGTGGFSADGTEYVVRVAPDGDGWALPPLPWSNVIANEEGGFVVTERGAGTTWAGNSRLHRLTPWFNDPVEDPHGEALYLRDAESGAVWSAAPGPCPAPVPYEIRHGWGYTTTHHRVDGLGVEVTEFVPREGAVRLTRLRVTNTGGAPRRVEATRYAHLVLGSLLDGSDRHVVTEWADGVLFARNPGAGAFAECVAFASASREITGYTADRDAFLGRHRDAASPLALTAGGALDGRIGARLDPCAALAVALDVAPGETAEVVFALGQADSREAADALARQWTADSAAEALREVRAFWADVCGAVRLETPEPALDVLVNGWLLYQDLACRMWGRSAYYQSGGAYGYRDQLQDASAFVYARPEITRAQILRNAGHQFVEGDVLHWWHPPTDEGIRTRFSDDLHWLPYITAHYLATTGDDAVLDEEAPFLTARPLEDGEDEVFLQPEPSGETGTVYEHAVRALDRGLATGAHDLPFMGVGDWNDGMNRVGREGRGESVWMGFFLYEILGAWAPICEARGDDARAATYRAHRQRLAEALNRTGAGWDGDWFRRAYYDDGTPLGTAEGDECQIDALVQAWSVLSGGATEAHAGQALDAMERRLVDREAGIIRLLTPAFDQTPHDPGYIKGYVPGVRENGGQYTHAALWAVRALAQAGRADDAAPLLAMLSPVSHTDTPEGVDRYMTEPYSVAADVYGVEPHVGRGGWTWYTGSAGWMYRVAVESVAGLGIERGQALTLAPCIPDEWPGFALTVRLPDGSGTAYAIEVARGEPGAWLDGEALPLDGDRLRVPLARDGATHTVRLHLAPVSVLEESS